MDRESDADFQKKQVADALDERTNFKRQEVRKKLKTLVKSKEDIEEILSSIEQYCSLILESL